MAASRPHVKARAMAGLVWFHRWIGIATCIIFAAWFASGAVLLFQPFPSLPKAEASAFAEAVAAETVRISPAAAIAAAGGSASSVRLVQRAGVPAYLVGREGGYDVVDARSGALLPTLDVAAARRIVAAAGFPVDHVSGPLRYDQWVVHNQYDPVRPLFRADLGDDAGTALYVSASTGEIVQRTTARERAWNWAGAVLHWIYVTPIRSSFELWDQSVWWLSFVTMCVTVAGIVLGVVRTVAVRRAGRPGFTYFRPRWMRWHHLIGLFSCVFIFAWMMSGWLSMDHGRFFSRGTPTPEQSARYHGLTVEAAARKIPLEAVRQQAGARAIGFYALGGVPVMEIVDAQAASTLAGADGRPIGPEVMVDMVESAIRAAWPGSSPSHSEPVAATDLYSLAEGMPEFTRRYPVGENGTMLYINGTNGALVTVMDRSRAAYAWIYYALHTFNFPGLAERPLLREVLILVPLSIGFAFSVTGVVIGYQRLRRSVRQGM